MSVMADASSVRPELFPLTTPWRKSSKSKTNRRARSLAEALGLGQRRSVSRRPADKRRAALKCELRGWHLPPQSHSRAGVAPSMVPPLAETHRRERTHRRMRQMARPVRAPPVPMRTHRRPVLMARREYHPHAARPENHAARRMRVRTAAAASGANAWATAHHAEGGTTCAAGSCGGCGAKDQPCCDNAMCTGSGTTCSSAGVAADGGTTTHCSSCGDQGQPCCVNSTVSCALGLTCGSGGQCTACGGPGQPCCDKGICGDGSCCFALQCIPNGAPCSDPRLGSGGTCNKGTCSQCGGIGQGCAGCPCEIGANCEQNRCVACGGAGEACCGEGTTAASCRGANIACRSQTCSHCGGPGESCCDGTGALCTGGCCVFTGAPYPVCLAEGATCPQTDGTCHSGSCSNCGTEGKACCSLDTCSPGLRCSGAGLCTAACGGPGEPCCPGNTCAKGCCVAPKGIGTPNECVDIGQACPGVAGACGADGSCTTCGGLGQGCCAALPNAPIVYCSSPFTTCLEPGYTVDLSQRVCQACGQRGLPCCDLQYCENGSTCDGTQCR
jgi:hypothetical protein